MQCHIYDKLLKSNDAHSNPHLVAWFKSGVTNVPGACSDDCSLNGILEAATKLELL